MTADVQNITQRGDCACISRDDSDMCYPPAVGISNVSERHEKNPRRNGCILFSCCSCETRSWCTPHPQVHADKFKRYVKCYNSLSVSISNKSRLISKGSGLQHNELMTSVMNKGEERISNQKQALLKVDRVLLERNIYIWFSRLI